MAEKGPGPQPRAGRRTQAERSARTQAALLDATVESLIELGYGRTTTTEIAHRAGLSLGALLHHYPTKTDLLVAAAMALLALTGDGGDAPDRLAALLRALPLPVIGRIRDGALVLDLRCLADDGDLLGALTRR